MKISVVIPFCHPATALAATLDSLLTQDYPDVEILVVDGGGTDGSVDLLRQRFPAGGGSAIHWISQLGGGRADAVNQGLRVSTGEVLAYLDPGDLCYPGALSAVAAYLGSRPDCLALYGRAHRLRPDGSVLEDYPTAAWDYGRLLDDCLLCQAAVFWRRDVMERFGVFDDSLEDVFAYEYWLRVGQHVPFAYLDDRYLAGSGGHGDPKLPEHRVRRHLKMARVAQRYASGPGPVLRRIKRLAGHRAAETELADAANWTERRRFVAAMAAHCLLYANEMEVPLTDAFLAELEGDLESVRL